MMTFLETIRINPLMESFYGGIIGSWWREEMRPSWRKQVTGGGVWGCISLWPLSLCFCSLLTLTWTGQLCSIFPTGMDGYFLSWVNTHFFLHVVSVGVSHSDTDVLKPEPHSSGFTSHQPQSLVLWCQADGWIGLSVFSLLPKEREGLNCQ